MNRDSFIARAADKRARKCARRLELKAFGGFVNTSRKA